MKNAVIYARFSNGPNQTDRSIEGQVADCMAYAERNDYKVIKVYADRHISGRSDNRAEFQTMLADSASKLFDAVIVWKTDRFGRNREETAINKHRLKKHGVRVLSAMENIPDTPEGVLIESLMEGIAEYYSLNLSQNIKRGMHTNASHGLAVGGHTPFGYQISTVNGERRYTVNESQRPVVVEIFTLFDKGWSFKEIYDDLNRRGITTSWGKPFNKSSLRPILSNEKYTGVYIYNDIRIEGGMPKIIERDLFDRVQKRLAVSKHNRHALRKKVVYMLSGKLFCEACGAPYIADAGTGKSGKVYHYYLCENKKKHKGCKSKTWRQDELEDIVMHVTAKYVLSDKNIEQIADNIIKINAANQESPYAASLIAKKADIDKRINNLIAAIEQGIFSSSTKERLDALEAEQRDAEAAILAESRKKPLLTREAVIWFLKQFKNASTTEQRNMVFRSLIRSVHIAENTLQICFNYTNIDGTAANARCSCNSELVETRGLEPLTF